jgi:hypothetical protein
MYMAGTKNIRVTMIGVTSILAPWSILQHGESRLARLSFDVSNHFLGHRYLSSLTQSGNSGAVLSSVNDHKILAIPWMDTKEEQLEAVNKGRTR